MAATLVARVHLGTRLYAGLPTLSNTRLTSTRSTAFVSCSNEPQRADSQSPGDWDAAWEKLKEERGKLVGVSGAEIIKAERPTSEFARKDFDFGDGRDAGVLMTKRGGSVRGGRYRLGKGAVQVLEFWGNGDVALSAGVIVIGLMLALIEISRAGASM